VSERARMEDQLHSYASDLEKKNEELRALDEMKNAFLTSVSHEVRTPLTSIRSFSEILLNYEDENPETRREFLQIINVETERLTRLINDVLDLAKITSGRVDWVCGPVDVEEAVQNSARLLKYELQRCGLEMEVDVQEGLEPAYSEPDRLVQVVNNLITNAIKFTPSGGLIRVSASMVEHEDGNRFVEVSVEDTGRGIPQEALETIFDRFVQVGEPAKGRPQGTGLGLSITKEIIERFGGRVWAESRLGEGSRFRFVLPVYDPEVHEREIAAAVDRQERSAQEEMQHGGS